MANAREGNHITLQQGADLRLKQYYIVKQTSGKAVLAAAATDKIIGVLDSLPTTIGGTYSTSEQVDVRAVNANGIGKVVAGGNVTAGTSYLTSDANGKAIATTTAGDRVIGLAMEDGVDGQVIGYLCHNFKY